MEINWIDIGLYSFAAFAIYGYIFYLGYKVLKSSASFRRKKEVRRRAELAKMEELQRTTARYT